MLARAIAPVLFACALLTLNPGPTAAGNSAHPERLAGKHIACFDGHFHYGASRELSTEKAAKAEAIASWEGFVDFEYGNAYSDWRIAATKSLTCTHEGSHLWGCNAYAEPCRVR